MKRIIFTLLILILFKYAVASCFVEFYATTTTSSNLVVFTNMSTPNYSSSFWDFGDGNFSNNNTSTPFNYTYANPGFYLVKLTVNYSDTCYSYFSQIIEVGDISSLCHANFSYVANGNGITFTDESQGNPNRWHWEFGDGTTSNVQNPPLHTYAADGYYNVKLLVFNTLNNCFDRYHKVIPVGTNLDCRADFNFLTDLGTDSVMFWDNSLGGIFTNFNWNFGDGTYSNLQNPKKKYSQPGFYNVCLSVSDEANTCYTTGCNIVPVRTNSNTCNASFNYFTNTGRIVNFRDNSTGNPTNFYWDLGDGNTATSQIVNHYYSNPGLYLVHLRVSNTNSSSDYVQLINVEGESGLQGMFAYLINNNYFPKAAVAVDFKGSSLGDPSRIIWIYGDGNKDSSSYTPNHVYADTGTYHVCVTVVDNKTNQTDTYCEDIHVVDNGINAFQSNKISLSSNPNPFSISTNITYFIPESTNVTLIIYDVVGNKKEVLVNKNQPQGIYTYVWQRKMLKAGLYLLEFKTESATIIKKITIIE